MGLQIFLNYFHLNLTSQGSCLAGTLGSARYAELRPHLQLYSYKNLRSSQVPSSSPHISLLQETVFLQATFHGTNRNKLLFEIKDIDLFLVSFINKYHKTIRPESEVYNMGARLGSKTK